jgi:transcription initiation factor TFIIIB Brf1 subunit/transcription initiation factor TFIIB
MPRCTDCGNTHIVETSHELVCNYCGLVLQERMFTDDPEWRSFSEGISTSCRAEVVIKSMNFETRQIIENIHQSTQILESVCQNGGMLYDEHHKRCGANQKLYVVSAFVFYAQREQNSGVRTKEEICEVLGFDIIQFNKVLTAVKEVLFQSTNAKHLVRHRDNVKDTMHRIVVCVPGIPDKSIQDVKRVMNRLHNKIDRSAEAFSSIQPEKLNAALVYMACRFLNIKMTIKEVSEATLTSMATIIKIEALVKDVLSSCVKAR